MYKNMCTKMARDKVLAAARFLEDATTQAESSLPGCIGPVTGLFTSTCGKALRAGLFVRDTTAQAP